MLFLIFILLFELIFKFTGPGFIFEAAEESQKFCSNLAPQTSPWLPQYQALVCGMNMANGDFKGGLTALGLIHLMVVSGGHLYVLLKLWSFIEARVDGLRHLKFFILIAYAFLTGFQPPVVRATLQILVSQQSQRKNWHFRSDQSVAISGLFCLVLFPRWIESWSLLLSWLASFSLCLPSKGENNRQIWIYLILFPAILKFQFFHPISILANLLLAPFLAEALFPLSLLCFLIPPLANWVDFLWTCLFWISKYFNTWIETTEGVAWLSLTWLWIYLILLHTLLHIYLVRSRR
jgi:ComEC/Rec2-related protein